MLVANLLLRMCPEAWQNQYDLTQESVPQDLRKLLTVLENIEKCKPSSNVPVKTSATANGSCGKPNGKFEKSGKHKGMNSNGDCIPKKARAERNCTLCKKYGGAHMTHNTDFCSKYEKDGTEKAGWSSKLLGTSASGKKKKYDSYAQLKESFSKLEKAVKKRNKNFKNLSSCKKKRYHSWVG